MNHNLLDKVFDIDHPVVWQYRRMVQNNAIQKEEAILKIVNFFFDQNEEMRNEILDIRTFMVRPVMVKPGSIAPIENPLWLSDVIGKIFVGLIYILIAICIGIAVPVFMDWIRK